MDKKYPKDTHVTLEMLLEIDSRPGPMAVKIQSMIEPPKPQPKEGEWWMCRYRNDSVDTRATLFHKNGQWFLTPVVKSSWHNEFITPLYKMVPAKEGE